MVKYFKYISECYPPPLSRGWRGWFEKFERNPIASLLIMKVFKIQNQPCAWNIFPITPQRMVGYNVLCVSNIQTPSPLVLFIFIIHVKTLGVTFKFTSSPLQFRFISVSKALKYQQQKKHVTPMLKLCAEINFWNIFFCIHWYMYSKPQLVLYKRVRRVVGGGVQRTTCLQ